MINFEPTIFKQPKTVLPVTAWGEIPSILFDIISTFNLKTDSCIEFGVDTGFSISALANYFDTVMGVDTFRGDLNTKECDIEQVREKLKDYSNITLIESTFEDFIYLSRAHFSLCHIDIIHTYKSTFECGEWAVRNCDCVLFHDTISYPEVMKAVNYLAMKYNKQFYNYEKDNGLGILI